MDEHAFGAGICLGSGAISEHIGCRAQAWKNGVSNGKEHPKPLTLNPRPKMLKPHPEWRVGPEAPEPRGTGIRVAAPGSWSKVSKGFGLGSRV